MAIVDGEVVPAPPAPVARGRVAQAIANAVMCMCFAILWLFFAEFSSMIVWQRTCGEECHEVQVKMIAILFGYSSAQSVLITMLLWSNSDTEADKAAPPPWTVLGDPGMLGTHVFEAFVLRLVLGAQLKRYSNVMGSRTEMIGSTILDVGFLGMEFLYCFVIIPTLVLRKRRMWMMRQSLDEKKVLSEDGNENYYIVKIAVKN